MGLPIQPTVAARSAARGRSDGRNTSVSTGVGWMRTSPFSSRAHAASVSFPASTTVAPETSAGISAGSLPRAMSDWLVPPSSTKSRGER